MYALLAKEYINKDTPLFFSNSDQFVEWDSNEFLYKMNETNKMEESYHLEQHIQSGVLLK